MQMIKRIVLLLISALLLAAWVHGGGQIPGSIVIDDLLNLVIDDLSNQVVSS